MKFFVITMYLIIGTILVIIVANIPRKEQPEPSMTFPLEEKFRLDSDRITITITPEMKTLLFNKTAIYISEGMDSIVLYESKLRNIRTFNRVLTDAEIKEYLELDDRPYGSGLYPTEFPTGTKTAN